MSPEAQRIAIAESVGIYLHDGDHAPSSYTFVSDLPDYLNDLNAMHEVEKMLNIDQKLKYVEILRSFDGSVSRKHSPLTWIYAHIATAAQRAEAYLRTIGKWEGGSDELQG